MKKPYVKPQLYAESYELVEHIAGNCATPDSFSGAMHRDSTPGGCGYDIGSIVIFGSGWSACGDEEFQEMLEWAGATGSTPADVAQELGLECYNSMYSASTSFFAS